MGLILGPNSQDFVSKIRLENACKALGTVPDAWLELSMSAVIMVLLKECAPLSHVDSWFG